MPCRSDSSRISDRPSSFPSRESSAIFVMSVALLTWYGSSVTTMASRPPRIFSVWARARIVMLPRPVVKASRMPAVP